MVRLFFGLFFFFISIASVSAAPKTVTWNGVHSPGTIVIVNNERKLYLVLDGGVALQYPIAIGRPGLEWTGERKVLAKAVNPPWTPTEKMKKRHPNKRPAAPGSKDNPLGVRALYIGGMYRIHGTNEPKSIGLQASSGCFRMYNSDVINLYPRVSVGAKVVVVNRLPKETVASLAQ